MIFFESDFHGLSGLNGPAVVDNKDLARFKPLMAQIVGRLINVDHVTCLFYGALKEFNSRTGEFGALMTDEGDATPGSSVKQRHPVAASLNVPQNVPSHRPGVWLLLSANKQWILVSPAHL